MVTHEEDPETGQPRPYCAAAGHDCSHLLGVLDLTFASCEGGFSLEREHEFHSPIHAAFSKHLIGGKSDAEEFEQLANEILHFLQAKAPADVPGALARWPEDIIEDGESTWGRHNK